LSLSGHVLGSGHPETEDAQQPDSVSSDSGYELTTHEDSDFSSSDYWQKLELERSESSSSRAVAMGQDDGRQLAAAYPFFKTPPYVSLVVFDSHDASCDERYDSPPIIQGSIIRDGTDELRKKQMACGIAPARFVFETSDLADYADTSILAKMLVRIKCHKAKFVESDSCQAVLDATGNFPKIDGCRFMAHEARFTLSTRLLPQSKYSITVKLIQPPGRNTASENSFDMTIEYYQMKMIEGTMAPVDIIHTIPNAKNESAYGNNYNTRGYITGFMLGPFGVQSLIKHSQKPGVNTKFEFAIRTFGHMGKSAGNTYVYAIDIIAYPTDLWKLGKPGAECPQYTGPKGTNCDLRSFSGALASESNGFRIQTTNNAMKNIQTTLDGRIVIYLDNPKVPCNSYWTATSFRFDGSYLPVEPYTVFLDRPISVLGKPAGEVAEWDLASVSIEQWVQVEFKPGNTMVPTQDSVTTTMTGILVIIPPPTFKIITTSSPQPPHLKYNSLPCATWPEADRLVGRWVCTLEDRGIFKETTYRVMLKVRNPTVPAAAHSWRIEMWHRGATEPVAITRSIRGMPVSGAMSASVSQANQLLGVMNTLQIEFKPTRDVGNVKGTRLEVIAPPGFVIVKRCLGFKRIQLPVSTCQGNNLNKFSLIMQDADALKANTNYIFKIDVESPSVNVNPLLNYWTFNTVRPDGIGKDTARYTGFRLYPYDFKTFSVLPLSRRTGSQLVVARFTPKYTIPFDDFLRIRAPSGPKWDSGNLAFESTNAATDARTFGTKNAIVIFETPNYLEFQLTTSAEQDFEYGIRARIIIPTDTPVPNMWWIEQFRQTGQSPPNQWRDIASMGAAGFESQVLIKTSLTPSNIVAEAWQNPTLITFQATKAVPPQTVVTALGSTLIPAEIYLEAPAGFTYICPLTPTVYMPQYSQNLPADGVCEVDHLSEANRNKLHIKFDGGLQAGVLYAFTIDIVNAPFVNPTTNTFKLQTRIHGAMVEEAILPGYKLATRMDNTRYIAGQQSEDRRVETTTNQVTFIIGTTATLAQTNTVLEVKAPVGFKFRYDCTSDVKWADYINTVGLLKPPATTACMNQRANNSENIAHAFMSGTWALGSYAIFARVTNPMFTPLINFWGFTIMERNAERTPLASETRVNGFQIKVILPTAYPGLIFHNPGNGIPGEAAMNIIDIDFTLTTPLQSAKSGRLLVTAPVGFRFPTVCRKFVPCLACKTTAGMPIVPGSTPLSAYTKCAGTGQDRIVRIYDFKFDLKANVKYSFRVLVVNPTNTFTSTNTASLYWRYETQMDTTSTAAVVYGMQDLHRTIPSQPVYQRLKYFAVTTTSRIGLATTTLRLHFRTFSPVPPQQTVRITGPEGAKFYGVTFQNIEGACYNEDPVLISKEFPAPLIGGVTRMPEWMSCRVTDTSTIELKNTESLLGGRPLIAGPVYEVFVRNVTNPQSSPYLNLFKIVAKTTTGYGQEVWGTDGYIIYPELTQISVVSTNEAFGLYTTFQIQMKVITEVPARGSIKITAPGDYYFGPPIVTPTNFNDPRQSQPPPSGESPERPPITTVTAVEVLRPKGWTCPFDFDPCVALTRPDLTPLQRTAKTSQCNKWTAKCNAGPLSALMTASSHGSNLEIYFKPEVALPQRTLFKFNVQGYNTRLSSEDKTAPNGGGDWSFITRNSDSEKTVLDRKSGVPGIDLMGQIFLDSMVPSDQKIGVVDTRVAVKVRLTNLVPPKAKMVIRFPAAFMRNQNAAFTSPLIVLGSNFPRQVERTVTQNVITLQALDEPFQPNVELEIDIGLTNPQISPSAVMNVWSFETSSDATGTWTQQNCNRDVAGFKIFGLFGKAQVTASVRSPLAKTIIAVWFDLKSVLAYTSTIVANKPRMKIWMPKGWKPLPQCGTNDKIFPFSRTYNVNREGVKEPFPKTVTYFEIPSGTQCEGYYDAASGLWYIELIVDGLVDYGLDYAFEFGATNPQDCCSPEFAPTTWRFETLQNGVILHLRNSIPGFGLEMIENVTIDTSHGDTTSQAWNRIWFAMMSAKYIPGGSKIKIKAPENFVFDCRFFRTDEGLSATTTCSVRNPPNNAEFVVDTQDPRPPKSPFTLKVNVKNPQFTPLVSKWKFEIVSPLNVNIDIRDNVPGFDVTDRVTVNITALSPFLGQSNPLRFDFTPSTIMNQADNGNEIVVTGPKGYIFPKNCSKFLLRCFRRADCEDKNVITGYPPAFEFPPPGITCEGHDNSTVVVRLPNGKGLLRNKYTLEIEVNNPLNQTVAGNTWKFLTRVKGQRLVDANYTLPGFNLVKLVALDLDESASMPLCHLRLWILTALALLATTRSIFAPR
jgi:hypothetical protein